jgi:uracil-DNA glycosylase family 4|tara:strand:- start:128 stop:844 length:717 start_codon:yes stop_codon:yes gene_type:complete
MIKKNNTRLVKLIKYYSLINHNLIYENEAINRYKSNSNLAVKGPRGKKLQDLKDSISKIKNCELKKASTNIVFSDGNPEAKIMIIGEGPGANEDLEGVPFIGRTGELLDKMLLSINLDRDNVYISNVVNYRPPDNRNPTNEEIVRYLPFLVKHIEIINPQILILLGSTALNAIIDNNKTISNVRGKWIEKKIGICNTSVIVSFHPAFLMRQPDQKKLSWLDLKMIRKKIVDLKINIGR